MGEKSANQKERWTIHISFKLFILPLNFLEFHPGQPKDRSMPIVRNGRVEIHPRCKTGFDTRQEGNHTGVNLEGVRLRKSCQSQRDKHCEELWFPGGAEMEAMGSCC